MRAKFLIRRKDSIVCFSGFDGQFQQYYTKLNKELCRCLIPLPSASPLKKATVYTQVIESPIAPL